MSFIPGALRSPLDPSQVFSDEVDLYRNLKVSEQHPFKREDCPKGAGATGKPLLAPRSEISLSDSKLVVWNKRVKTFLPEGFPVALWTPSGVFSDGVNLL